MKTAELAGNTLSYTLCMIEMPHLVWGTSIGIHAHSNQIVVPELKEPQCYSPFMDWLMCGPIIERECIDIFHQDNGYHGAIKMATDEIPHPCPFFGETSLIAAMRCYCCAKLGDEVEIPDELRGK